MALSNKTQKKMQKKIHAIFFISEKRGSFYMGEKGIHDFSNLFILQVTCRS